MGGVTVGCLYLPNGNPAPGPKFDYKLKWFERLNAHAAGLLDRGGPVVLAGDYNVIPTERDVYKPERWVDDALFLPETREAYRRLLAQGWTDALRHLHPDETIYTFWDYMRGAFSATRASASTTCSWLAPRLKAAGSKTTRTKAATTEPIALPQVRHVLLASAAAGISSTVAAINNALSFMTNSSS